MSLLSHKRERSLGLAPPGSASPPDSLSPISSSSSDSTTPEDDDGDEEWTEGPPLPSRRTKSKSTSRRGGGGPPTGSSTDALRTLQMQQAARPRRSLPPDHGGQGLLTPQSATFPSGVFTQCTSAEFAHDGPYALQQATSTAMSRSTTLPIHLQQRPHHLELSTSTHSLGHGHAHGHAGFARHHPSSAIQPPSLSPMTLNSPFFPHSAPAAAQFDFGFPPADGEPITPVSPYDAHAYDPADYATSYASHLQLEFLSSSSSSAHPSPFPGPAPPASAYSLPGEPSRSKLKRSHSSREPYPAFPSSSSSSPLPITVVPENGAFLHRQHEPFGEPFVGPQTELEAAASMAAMAAAKTGAGAGAFVYKVYHMLLDDASQHLIAFNQKGTSFIVTNTVLFSRDVLPKYFKHSNFSSFVRQLNMYNFHKVNKTPRGASRALAESQEWEFTHPKFVRGKPHQLEEIKRKAPDSALPDPPSSSSMTRSLSLSGTELPRHERERDERLSQSQSQSHSSRPSAGPSSTPLVPLAPPPPPPPPTYSMPPPPPVQPSYLPQPAPLQRSASHDGSSRPAPLPLPLRVQQLEQQRFELATALAGTQDGYEALYRDLVDSRRREDALVQIVEELYGVVQRNFSGQLPYQFPSHVFAPRPSSPPSSSHPQISVTASYPSSPSFDPALYHPQPTRSLADSGYYGSPTLAGPAAVVGLGLSGDEERWVGMAEVEGSSLSAFAGRDEWEGRGVVV